MRINYKFRVWNLDRQMMVYADEDNDYYRTDGRLATELQRVNDFLEGNLNYIYMMRFPRRYDVITYAYEGDVIKTKKDFEELVGVLIMSDEFTPTLITAEANPRKIELNSLSNIQKLGTVFDYEAQGILGELIDKVRYDYERMAEKYAISF